MTTPRNETQFLVIAQYFLSIGFVNQEIEKYDLYAEMKQIVYLICVKNREQTGASSRSPHHMLAWLNGRAAV